MGYLKDSLKGVSWMGALRLFIRGLGFIRIAILARILTPAQFGLYGIASLALSFLEILTGTGINVFLIQLKEKIDDYINTAWVVSILRGIIISALLLISSNIVANFFNNKESLPLLLLVSIVPFIRGFINPAVVKFRKNLEFNKEFYVQSFLYLIDASTVITLAFIYKSASSLVWGLVVSAIFEVIISFAFIKPRPVFSFDKNKLKQIINRGKWVTGFGIFNYLYQNVDDAFVGRLLGTSLLGIYQVAYKISSLPVSEVTEVFSRVTFPVYTKINTDILRLRKAFMKIMLVSGFLMMILGTILFVFPKQVVLFVLGSNWLEAVPVLKVLAIFGIFKGVVGEIESLFLAVEKQEYIAAETFVMLLVLLITIIPFVRNFGIVGAAYSAVLGSLFGLVISFYFLLKVLNEKKS